MSFKLLPIGPLPGTAQAVPRAELFAAVTTLRLLRGKKGVTTFVTDCIYVHNGFRNRKGHGGRGKNGDLWAALHELVDERRRAGDEVLIEKVRAHATPRHFASGLITWGEFAGNAMADPFAGQGAKLNRLPEEVIRRVEELD